MADVNANIGINIETSEALSQLKSLQRQISQFHTSIAKSSETAALAQRNLQRNFINGINSIGAFSAELRTVKTTAESFTDALEKNKFSMREYFRYAGASTRTFGKLFKSEFDTIGKVAEENVKRLQTQYIKMGRDASGAMRAIAVMPNDLDMSKMSTQLQLAAQRQALFNQLVKQGSTNLLNFGKNTQWAGRQLMVGFTLPLAALGTTASRVFMDMETAAIKFRKVYGDLFTPAAEREQALADIGALGEMFTKYGIAVSQTVNLAAEAAAAGFQGLDLQRQVTEATRLQVLGQVDQQKALETTISLQNAFQMNSENLADSINFLNAVENQTVVSLDDITTAIPKAAPVVKQLGGDVKDLAFFMAAMKEGGINASEGANALKSGLASLINPTDKATEMMRGFGIDIDSIVNKNAGNVKQTVIEFAQALDNLSDLNRQRAIEQLFGKFQLARLSTLFENVTKDGNQASRVLDLAAASTSDLANMAEQELGMTAESGMMKFRKAVEDLKLALVPVGQTFLEAVTPIVEFIGGFLDKFNNLSSGTKKIITVLTVAIGAIGPVALMTFGLLANGVANVIKGLMVLRQGYLRLTGQSQILGEQTEFLTVEQQKAAAVAHSLDQSHARLTQTFNAEAGAVRGLANEYRSALSALQTFAAQNPGAMLPPKKFNKGISIVPGSGNRDTVPAMLTPGEAVIPKDMAKKYAPLINGMIANNIPGYAKGVGKVPGNVFGTPTTFSRRSVGPAIESRILELPQEIQNAIKAQIPQIVEALKGTSISVETFGQELKNSIDKGLLALKKSQLGRFVEDESSSAPAGLAKRKASMQAWDTRAAEMAAKEQLAKKYASLSPEQLRQVGFDPKDTRGMAGTSIAHLIPKEAGKVKSWATKTADGIARLQAEDTAINAYLNDLSATGQNFKDKLSIFMQSITTTAEQQEGVIDRLSAGQQPRNKREYEILAQVARQDIATRGTAASITGQAMSQSYRAEFAASAAEIRTKSQGYFTPEGGINPYYQNFDPAATAKKAESDGKSDAISYDKGRKSAAVPDMYEESRNRQSPHRLAEPDGIDDARAYEAGREKESSKRSRATLNTRKATAAAGAPMQNVAAGVAISEATRQSADTMKKSAISFQDRMTTLNRSLLSGSFAIGSLAGIASMSGGKLGEFAGTLSKLNLAMFTLMSVTQLLTQQSFLRLAADRAGAAGLLVQNIATKKFSMAPGLFAGGIKKLLPNLARFGMMIGRFLGPIGVVASTLGIAYTIIQRRNKAEEETRKKLEAFSDVLSTTKDQAQFLGDYFNFIPLKGSLEEFSKGLEVVASKTRTEREKIRGSEQFQTAYKDTIGQVRGMTSKQAEAALTFKGVELISQGMAREQVQLLIDTIKEEAGKQDLKFDFKNIKFDDASISLLTGQLSESLTGFQKTYQKGLEKAFQYKVTGTGRSAQVKLVESLLPNKEAKAALKNASAGIASYSESINRLVKSSAIDANQFKKLTGSMFDAIEKSVPDSTTRLKLFNAVLRTIDPDLAKATKGVKDLEQKQLLLQSAIAGVSAKLIMNASIAFRTADALNKVAQKNLEAFGVKDTTAEQAFNRAKANEAAYNSELALNKAMEDAIALQKKLNNALSGGGGGGGGEGPYDKAKKSLEEQLKELQNTQEAYKKLKSMGVETGRAFEIASDSILAAAIASDSLSTTQWETLKGLIKDVNAELLNSELLKFFETRTAEINLKKQFAEILPLLKEMGLNTEDIQDILSNPDLARAFIEDLKDGSLESAKLKKYIDQIPNLKKIDIILGISADDAKEELRRKADELFSFLERAAERAFKRPIKAAEDAVKDAQDAVDKTQEKIDGLQETIDKKQRDIEIQITRRVEDYQTAIDNLQREIETSFNRPIEAIQEQIATIERGIELDFDRPIAALQETSSDLSNDLALMDKQAESINEKYDLQVEALSKVSDLNKDIAAQQKQQISLADALSQGDISAAAQMAQEMRASAAESASNRAQEQIQAQRQISLDKLRNSAGLTRKQIEEKQFAISQQIYLLEEKREAVQSQIQIKQDEIYQIELRRKPLLDAIQANEDQIYILETKRKAEMLIIRGYEDQIYNIKVGQLATETDLLDKAKKHLEEVKQQLQARLDDIEARKDAWEADKDAEIAAKVAAGEYNDVITATLGILESIEQKWKDIEEAARAAAAAGAGGGGGGGGGNGGTPNPNTEYVPPPSTPAEEAALDQLIAAAEAVDAAALALENIENQLDDVRAAGAYHLIDRLLDARENAKKKLESAQNQYNKIAGIVTEPNYSGGSGGGGGDNLFMARGGLVKPKYMAVGGLARGTDKIPAMLTPGEFVMSKYAVSQYGTDKLKAMNSGTSSYDSVYNYSVNVNVKSGSNPEEIARAVMMQIKNIDNQRVKGQRI
jgi:TP901 family phage tail tape measure protein